MRERPQSTPISRAIRLAIEAAKWEAERATAVARGQRALSTLLTMRVADCRKAIRRELGKVRATSEDEA